VCNENCIIDIVVKAISWPKRIVLKGFGYLEKYYGRLWNLRKSKKSKWYWGTIGRQNSNNLSVL